MRPGSGRPRPAPARGGWFRVLLDESGSDDTPGKVAQLFVAALRETLEYCEGGRRIQTEPLHHHLCRLSEHRSVSQPSAQQPPLERVRQRRSGMEGSDLRRLLFLDAECVEGLSEDRENSERESLQGHRDGEKGVDPERPRQVPRELLPPELPPQIAAVDELQPFARLEQW